MPWNTVSAMSLRREFVMLALTEGCNRRELCRRFGISPKTATEKGAGYIFRLYICIRPLFIAVISGMLTSGQLKSTDAEIIQ